MDKQKVTGGKWLAEILVHSCFINSAHPKNEYIKIPVGQIIFGGDANLIVTAVNQCKSINPEHPEYVAEKIGEMHKGLKSFVLLHKDDYDTLDRGIGTATIKGIFLINVRLLLNAIERRV